VSRKFWIGLVGVLLAGCASKQLVNQTLVESAVNHAKFSTGCTDAEAQLVGPRQVGVFACGKRLTYVGTEACLPGYRLSYVRQSCAAVLNAVDGSPVEGSK